MAERFRHGIVGYQKHGCRCAVCRTANRDRARMVRRANKPDNDPRRTYKRVPDEVVEQAACRGKPADWWFPQRGDVGGTSTGRIINATNEVWQALAICNACPVKEPCLQHALDACEKVGIWGGTFERQRRAMRRERRMRTA